MNLGLVAIYIITIVCETVIPFYFIWWSLASKTTKMFTVMSNLFKCSCAAVDKFSTDAERRAVPLQQLSVAVPVVDISQLI